MLRLPSQPAVLLNLLQRVARRSRLRQPRFAPAGQKPAGEKPPVGKLVGSGSSKVPGKPAPPPAAPKPEPKPAPIPKKQIPSGTRKLGQVLVDLGFIDEAQMEALLEESRTTEISLEQVAIRSGLVTEDQLLQGTAEQMGLRLVNLDEVKATPTAVSMVQQQMAELYKMLPLAYENDVLTVVMADPNNLQALDDIRNFLGIQSVIACLAPPRKIEEAIAKAYASTHEESIGDMIAGLELDTTFAAGRRETSIDISDMEEMANAQPVRKLINMVLLMAIRDHASDIHFEPFEDEYKMRYRCDGVLYEMVPPPRHLATAISSRIKVMANLDIAERRLPQDGRIELNLGGNAGRYARQRACPPCSARVSCIRVLDRTVVSLDLEKVGTATRRCWREFRDLIARPNGITLVTGPTGAGKTTTLYSALNELNADHRKDHHHRRPGRVRNRRDHSMSHQCRNRDDVRPGPAGHPAARSRQDPGGRDPRPGNGPDRHSGRADRTHGFLNPAHQRCTGRHHSTARHGCRALS